METLKIRSNTRVLAVEWPDGKKRNYTVDVSNRQRLKEWLGQESSLGSLQGLNGEKLNAEAVDKIYEVCEGLIFNIFDRKEAEEILKRSNSDFVILIQLIVKAAELANSSLSEGLKSVKSFVESSN